MSNDNMSEQLSVFADTLSEALHGGEKFVSLLTQLMETDDPEKLLEAADQLSKFVLGNQLVQFPYQYSAQDYYLLFTARLLGFHQQHSFEVQIDDQQQTVTSQLHELGAAAVFEYELDQSQHGGAFLTEKKTGEQLVYINLQKRMVRFNNQALINLFVVKLHEVSTTIQIQQAVNPLIALAYYLQNDLGFSVDFGILSTVNTTQYFIENSQLPLEIIDKLFVATAGTDYMLMNLNERLGMSIQLSSDVKLSLSQQNSAWSFEVTDDKDAVSFFDCLISYQLIRDWFLANRKDLEIKSDSSIFSTIEDH